VPGSGRRFLRRRMAASVGPVWAGSEMQRSGRRSISFEWRRSGEQISELWSIPAGIFWPGTDYRRSSISRIREFLCRPVQAEKLVME
jgi:hypothetical protein